MPEPDLQALAATTLELARRAGVAVLNVYDDAGARERTAKADGSPLTRADLASHRILVDGLAAATPHLPVLSEESDAIAIEERLAWRRYWLIDPLDGTKEFLNRNGEFTINVALIERTHGIGRAILGVVHVPVTGETYVGGHGIGAVLYAADVAPRRISTGAPSSDRVRVVASRSHGNGATDAFIAGLETLFGIVDRTTSGSSLKLCRVADGSAHYYPRAAPTMEWDTAAAQAIVEAAGGHVWRYGTCEPLVYGKPELLNPPFLVVYADDAPLPDAYRLQEPA